MGRPKSTTPKVKKSRSKNPKKYDYDVLVGLNETEKLFAKDTETNQTRLVHGGVRPNNIPDGFQPYAKDEYFDKVTYASRHIWLELQKELSDLEFRVATTLAMYGQMNNNSLKPLNNNVMLKDLSVEFNISINRVKPVFDKLFKLGVYAKISVADVRYPGIENFWVLNPHLSFSGGLIKSELFWLFEHTPIAKMYNKSFKLSKPKMRHIEGSDSHQM